MKTKQLSRRAIQHLINLGNFIDENNTLEMLIDAPYLFVMNNQIIPGYSNSSFQNSALKEVSENEILKLQNIPKKLSHNEKLAYDLVKMLNSEMYNKESGYQVIFGIMALDFGMDKLAIYPMTNGASGSISKATAKIAIEFSDKNNLDIHFSYCNPNKEKERYGTHTPCITIYK